MGASRILTFCVYLILGLPWTSNEFLDLYCTWLVENMYLLFWVFIPKYVTCKSLAIHHLFFVDDSLFLFKMISLGVKFSRDFQQIWKSYMTGYKSWSSLTFGKKVDCNLKEQIQSKLRILSEGGAGTYLGLPECFSGSKVELLNYIRDKRKGRMSGWYTSWQGNHFEICSSSNTNSREVNS